ncbi:MAG: radical SAM protein [Candidatus Omnitrophota bacterium]
MSILLISPPPVRIRFNISGIYPLPPLGLAYIASLLEKNGYGVKILDMPALRTQSEDLSNYLKGDNYSVCGLSCNIFNLKNGIRISQIIKRENPKAKVILGGHCTVFPPEIIFKYGPDFDVMVKGEGEEAMLNLCGRLNKGGECEVLYDVPNISFRHNAKIINNSSPPSYADLDKLPLPARHLLPNNRYRIHPPFGLYPPVTLMETSRGCAYNCIFCTLPQQVRERSIDNVTQEIKEVVGRYKVKEIHFVDPNFTYNQGRIMQLCTRLIKERLKFRWTCKTRVDLVSKDLLKAMSGAGCYMISYGIESGSQRVLNTLNKGISVGQIENCFILSREAKIRTLAYILLGSPGENNYTVRETIRLVGKIKPDFVLYGELLPDPNSILVKQTIGERRLSYDELAEYYLFNSKNNINESITDLPRERVKRWISGANKKFYFRPGYFLNRIKSLKNINDFLNQIRGVYFLMLDKVRIKEIV